MIRSATSALISGFAIVALAATPAAAQADAVLGAILADSARAPVPAFERTVRAELRADATKEPAVVVDRFVPRSATTGTWTLVSIDGRKPTDADVSRYNAGKADALIPGFHRLHLILGGPVTQQADSQGRTVYRWASLPKGAVMTPGGDISAHLSAEALVEDAGGKPMLSRVRLYAAKPFKIRGIATMNSFDVVSLYRPSASGVPFLVTQTSASDVKAPFGLGGKRRSQISFKAL